MLVDTASSMDTGSPRVSPAQGAGLHESPQYSGSSSGPGADADTAHQHTKHYARHYQRMNRPRGPCVDADTRMTCTDSAEDAHCLPFWAGQVIDAVEASSAHSVTIEFTPEMEFRRR